MPENPTISIEKLISVSATPGVTKSWMVAGTARGLDSLRVQFIEPWDSHRVTAFCLSSEDMVPDSCRDIDRAEGERIWIARFDIENFGAHHHLGHLLNYLQNAGNAKAVVEATSTPDPQVKATKSFTPDLIDFDSYEFDVGVLLVHGIGQHVRGQTLVSFSDPLINFMRGWYSDFNRRSASAYRGNVETLRHAIESGVLDNDPRRRGVREELVNFIDAVPQSNEAGAGSHAGDLGSSNGPILGSAQLGEVVLTPSPTDPGIPARAQIRLGVIDEKATPREATVLLSEAWWTPSIVPPTRQQLLDWVFRVLPLMVSAHITLPLRRAQRHSDKAKPGFSEFAAFCEEWLARLWILLIFGPVSLLLCLATQLLLSVLGAIAALPIPRLRMWLTPILEWLIGSPGQSYVLLHSPIRRGSIVSDVDRNLDWVCSRCRKVIVVAHSQGAVVARFVLANKRREQFDGETVKHLITVGSGIKKLTMLEGEKITQFASLCVNFIFVFFVFLGLRLWQPDYWDWLVGALHLPLWLDPSNLAWPLLLLFFVSIAFIRFGEAAARPAPALHNIPWTDYYASHDPVPSGPMATVEGIDLKSFEVNNCASILKDHNSYWDNTEEIVAPVAMAIMQETALPFQHLTADDKSCLDSAKERRKQRVRTLAWIKVATAVGAATLLSLLLLANWGRVSGGALVFPTAVTLWNTLMVYGPLLPALSWEGLPVLIVLAWSWAARWLVWRQVRRDADALPKRQSSRTGVLTILAHLLLALASVGLLVHWWRAGDRGETLLVHWKNGLSQIFAYLDSLRLMQTVRFEPSVQFDPTSADWYAKIWEIWTRCIRAPEQFLERAFVPTWQQFSDAMGLYLIMLSLSALIYAFIAFFLVNGDWSARVKWLSYALLSLLTTAVAAMVIHFAFWALGGRASFYGTCVAYIYGMGPYLPLLSLAMLIMAWSMPAPLRASAIGSPSRTTSQAAMQDPSTSKWVFVLGSLLSLVLTGLSLFAMFRSLSVAHALGWVRLAAAIILSLVALALVRWAMQALASLLFFLDRPDAGQAQPALAPAPAPAQ